MHMHRRHMRVVSRHWMAAGALLDSVVGLGMPRIRALGWR
jgi:hypothetical protein